MSKRRDDSYSQHNNTILMSSRHQTTFLSELDLMPATSKHRVTGFIPEDDFAYMFESELTFHGAQARIVSALLVAFIDAYNTEKSTTPDESPIQRASRLINQLTFQTCP